MGFLNNIISPDFILYLPGLLIGLSVHEFAHAWVAYRYGDPTAYWHGRVTLNPVAHIDPMGLICLVFFKFGWGKPVPVNPGNFRKPIEAQIAVSLAGVIANIIVLFATAFIYGIILFINPGVMFNQYIETIVYGIIAYNAGLAVFNLVPLPPLDGSKVLKMLLPYQYARVYAQFTDQMGSFILIMLSWSGILSSIIYPFNRFLITTALQLAYAISGLW